MTTGLDLKEVITESFKNLKCGNCIFQERAPRPPNQPIDLSEPSILICRESPPQIVYAIGQHPTNKQPIPIPMGSSYPMIDSNFPACSKFRPKQTT